MIDREARNRYAQLLRHFASGRITNFDYDDGFDAIDSKDDAILQIYVALWPSYSDVRKHTMTGSHALTREQRHIVARWITFLYSDFEYEWPVTKWGGCLLNLFTLGLWKRLSKPNPGGEDAAWPFFHKADLAAELHHPRLLAAQTGTYRRETL